MVDVRHVSVESPIAAQIVIAGQSYINFGGSSYLGLSGNAQVIEAGIEGLKRSGAGIPAARDQQLISPGHQRLEAEAARFFGSEAAVYLASGYFFGSMAISALRAQFDVILYDELAHYSLREAVVASGCISHTYPHLDAEALRATLRTQLSAAGRPLIVTDGVFPTFGDLAPVAELFSLAQSYGGHLLVDESHSFGVLGHYGRGAAEYAGVPSSSVHIGGSLGKAFGSYGGIIPCAEALATTLRMTPAGRGASGGLPACAQMCATSLRYVREHPELLSRLRTNVAYLKRGLRSLGLKMNDTPVPIATFALSAEHEMQRLKDELMREGIFVYHSNYIGGGSKGVIRCGIFADHTMEHLDQLIGTLKRLL
jgi:8-amino-7-oxononanoate synthase